MLTRAARTSALESRIAEARVHLMRALEVQPVDRAEVHSALELLLRPML